MSEPEIVYEVVLCEGDEEPDQGILLWTGRDKAEAQRVHKLLLETVNIGTLRLELVGCQTTTMDEVDRLMGVEETR